MKPFLKLFSHHSAIWLIIIVFVRCESKDRYYRPDLPEQLCCVGIIDIDDSSEYNLIPELFNNSTRVCFMTFEKSYQSEYPEEANDSLRDFSFSISSEEKEIFSYHCDSTIKALKGFKIPDDTEFQTNEKFYLHASEKSTRDISAEITVPESPPVPELISVSKEIISLSAPTPCIGYTSAESILIDFSFTNDKNKESFYAILLTGKGNNVSSSWPFLVSQLEYSVKYCNAPGFFAELNGFTMYQWTCMDLLTMVKVPVYAYFIDGSKIPSDKCIMKISTQYKDERSPFTGILSLKVRLLSVPKSLFLFEKSLYIYGKVAEDPFSEPVYLNGNIKDGNGIFAVCRSSELTLKFNWILGYLALV